MATVKYRKNTAGLRRGGGRPKGAPNKVTAALKDMVLNALNRAGGELYLSEQATKNSSAFLALVGKILPLQVGHSGQGTMVSRVVHEHRHV